MEYLFPARINLLPGGLDYDITQGILLLALLFLIKEAQSVKKRFYKIAVSLSASLAVMTLMLWITTFFVNPWDHLISFTRHFHICVWEGFSGDVLGRLVFFSHAEAGPYRGSMTIFGGPNSSTKGWNLGDYGIEKTIQLDRNGKYWGTKRACDFPGIYFRYFKVVNEQFPYWTLMVSLWHPFLVFSILPVIWIIRRWRLRRKDKMT